MVSFLPIGSSLPKYFEALNDKYGSVRYWAVVGLHQNARGKDVQKAIKAVRLIEDESWSVKIAIAEALADWDGDIKSLKFLAGYLSHREEKVRLLAATSLDRLGEKALPVLGEIEAAIKTHKKDRYLARLLKYTVYRLKNKTELFS